MVTSWENRAAPALSVYSSIAQSVERMTVNHDVAGSSPAWGANFFESELFTGFGFFCAFIRNIFAFMLSIKVFLCNSFYIVDKFLYLMYNKL